MADDKSFQPGDVVGLKSGRPGSTCQWFTAGEELREAGFANGMLEKRQPATAADLARLEASGGCGSLAKIATATVWGDEAVAGWFLGDEGAKSPLPPAQSPAVSAAAYLGMPGPIVVKVAAVSDDRFEAVTTDGRFRFTDVRPSRHVAGLGTVIGGVAVGDEVEITTDDGETYYLSRSIRRRMINAKTGEVLMAGVGGIQPEEPATTQLRTFTIPPAASQTMSAVLANRAAGKPTLTAPFGVDLNPVPPTVTEAMTLAEVNIEMTKYGLPPIQTEADLRSVRLAVRGSGLPFSEAGDVTVTAHAIATDASAPIVPHLFTVTAADGTSYDLSPAMLAAWEKAGMPGDVKAFAEGQMKQEAAPADAPDSLTYFNSVMGFQGDR